ncbi:hypothetical protein EBX31_14490, partial [bacterium]|nr:hypothetical protein [bacterium]
MAKAALAFPEAADEAKRRGLPLDVMLEKKVRELLPEWHSMKPEKVVPATLTEAEKGYSDMARAYLTAFDQLEIVTLTQDGTTEM